jgi:hypothetical protein
MRCPAVVASCRLTSFNPVWRQAVMQQLLAMGAVSKLPEEVQWNVRVLLPRKEEPAAAAAKAAQAVAGPAVIQFPGLHMPMQQVTAIPCLVSQSGQSMFMLAFHQNQYITFLAR